MENIRVENKELHKSITDNHYVYHSIKRLEDIVISLLALIILSPIILVISILIYKEDNHNPIYVQKRIGLHGKPFKMFKFRSMIFNADNVLMANPELYQEYLKNDFKLPEGKDPRVTKIGTFIRKTSLDEIPQFVNVLLGQMSLVGPRPIVQKELHEYGKDLDEFLSVKPGALGLWQASGRSNIGYPERCDVELKYVRNASFLFDIKVFFKCCISILKKDGAF